MPTDRLPKDEVVEGRHAVQLLARHAEQGCNILETLIGDPTSMPLNDLQCLHTPGPAYRDNETAPPRSRLARRRITLLVPQFQNRLICRPDDCLPLNRSSDRQIPHISPAHLGSAETLPFPGHASSIHVRQHKIHAAEDGQEIRQQKPREINGTICMCGKDGVLMRTR